MTALRQRMIDDLRIRNYSPNTIKTYVYWIARFAKHFDQSPDQLDLEQIRDYQRFLVNTKKASWSQFNQAVCALRFFYRVTLRRPDLIEQIPFPKTEKKLPIVLSIEEVARLLQAVSNLKHRTVLTMLYAAGLRLGEAVGLRLIDIDSQRMTIRVQQGKGRKDRYVDLSPALLVALRQYWKAYRPKTWLFPGGIPNQPLSSSSIQKALARARLVARIDKPVHAHTLRHCFATQLLEAGKDLRTIQDLLGHRSLNTTGIYLHVASRASQSAHNPIDLLQIVQDSQTEP